MFEIQIKELFSYLTKNVLKEDFTIVKSNRKSIVEYTTYKYKWILASNESFITKENYNTEYLIKDTTKLFFINEFSFGEIKNKSLCRVLTKEDELIFDQFKNSCSKEDIEEGMVSLDDDFVCGLICDNKIVAVSSLWNWGNIISDLGVLVHPDYRKRGYAKTVCQYLMSSIDKKFVWRCDSRNKASYNLALSIGFIESGLIQELVNI